MHKPQFVNCGAADLYQAWSGFAGPLDRATGITPAPGRPAVITIPWPWWMISIDKT